MISEISTLAFVYLIFAGCFAKVYRIITIEFKGIPNWFNVVIYALLGMLQLRIIFSLKMKVYEQFNTWSYQYYFILIVVGIVWYVSFNTQIIDYFLKKE